MEPLRGGRQQPATGEVSSVCSSNENKDAWETELIGWETDLQNEARRVWGLLLWRLGLVVTLFTPVNISQSVFV